MISLDQVYLLEQKVESAVAKIQQLQAENDALRSKCLELTNALSSKSEQLTSFESDQNQIEDGIKKALDRLSFIENSVLKAAGQAAESTQKTSAQQIVQTAAIISPAPVQPVSPIEQTEIQETFEGTPDYTESADEPEYNEPVESDPADYVEPEVTEDVPTFNSMEPVPSYEEVPQNYSNEIPEQEYADSEENQDDLGFDIF